MIEKVCNLISKEIDSYIKKNKITISEFAIRAGIPQRSFINVRSRLNKNIIPGNQTLQKIEKVLNNK